jgi:hypothetical protein
METAGRVLGLVFGGTGLVFKIIGAVITILVIFFVAKALITGESLDDHRNEATELHNRAVALDGKLVSQDPDALSRVDVAEMRDAYSTLLNEAIKTRPDDLKGDIAKLWDGDTELLRGRVEFLRLFEAVVLDGDSSQSATLEAHAKALDRLSAELDAIVDRLNDSE